MAAILQGYGITVESIMVIFLCSSIHCARNEARFVCVTQSKGLWRNATSAEKAFNRAKLMLTRRRVDTVSESTLMMVT